MFLRRLFLVFVSVAISPSLLSAGIIQINEVLIDPSLGPIGQQFFELKGMANQSLNDLSFVVLIGEGPDSGIVDQVLDLSPHSLGANGLLLWRDVFDPLNPAPDTATTVVSAGLPLPAFFSDISQTFALIEGFAAAPGDDLDFDDDGLLDAAPWTSVHDAIGVRENDGTPADEFAFGTQMGFADFASTGFNPDAIFRDGNDGDWYASDVSNTAVGGPFMFDSLEFVDLNLNSQAPANFTFDTLSPGSANAAAVPEPSTGVVLLLATLLASGRFLTSRFVKLERS